MEMDNVLGPELDQTNVNDFGFIDFMDESNFEQFIELIRGENAEPAAKFCPNYDCEHISGCLLEETAQIIGTTSSSPPPQPPVTGGLFDFNLVNDRNDDDEINNNNNPEWGGGGGDSSLSAALHLRGVLGLEENEGDRESSATTTRIPMKTKTTKTDRSKTLISERKRRGRMKEKLYALRSLVPNITKMDKASIIGDAVLYIQELQTHAKKLKAEILDLETSLTTNPAADHDDFQEKSIQNNNAKKLFKITVNPQPVIKRILQMEVFQLEVREFYGRIVCNKELGIAGLLYKALESLTSFKVHSTNLAALADNYVLTFTLHVEEVMEMEIMNLPNLKLWIASVFLNLGFDFLELPQV